MGGSILGFKSFLIGWPAAELTVAVMANQDGFAHREEIAHRLAAFFLGD